MSIIENISCNLTAWMVENPSLDTIKKLSVRSGVGFGTVQRIKNGDGNPTISNLFDIAKAFGRTVEDLLAAENSERQHQSVNALPDYLPPAEEILAALRELDPPDAEIFVQTLKLEAMKARRKKDARPPILPASE